MEGDARDHEGNDWLWTKRSAFPSREGREQQRTDDGTANKEHATAADLAEEKEVSFPLVFAFVNSRRTLSMYNIEKTVNTQLRPATRMPTAEVCTKS
jgi:hypothetical protein